LSTFDWNVEPINDKMGNLTLVFVGVHVHVSEHVLVFACTYLCKYE
jgi:hypothetical protein